MLKTSRQQNLRQNNSSNSRSTKIKIWSQRLKLYIGRQRKNLGKRFKSSRPSKPRSLHRPRQRLRLLPLPSWSRRGSKEKKKKRRVYSLK
jgi:hypothetical protein